MTRTPEQVTKLLQDAWDLYHRIPRVLRSVNLYAAGFVFGQLQLGAYNEGNVETLPVVTDDDLMREIGVNLYVAGYAQAHVEVAREAVYISRETGCEFRYSQSGGSGKEMGALWPVAANHDVLLSPQAAEIAKFTDLMSPLFIPPALLSSDLACQLSGGAIADELVVYISTVKEMKFQFAAHLRKCLSGQLRIVSDDWQPEFYPAVQGQSGILAMGNVYKVFKNEGIDLMNLKNEVMGIVSQRVQAGMMPRSTVKAIIDSFDSFRDRG